MKKLIYLTFCILAITACNSSSNREKYNSKEVEDMKLGETTILKVNTDSIKEVDISQVTDAVDFDFGSLVSEVKAIKLETTEKSIVGVINKIIITPSNIIIYDNYQQDGAIIFDKEGHYIKRIARGNGPGEINRLWDIDYDYENNEIYVYNHPFFKIFDENGKYKRDVKLPLGFYNFKVIDNKYLLKGIHNQGNYHAGDFHNYTFFVLNKDMQVEKAALNYIHDVGYGGQYNMSSNGKDVNVTNQLCDTIYTYKDGYLYAKYKLKYNNHISETVLNDKKRFWEQYEKQDVYCFLGEYLETNDYATIFLSSRRGTKFAYLNKKTGKIAGGQRHSVDEKRLPYFICPFSTYEDYFVSYIQECSPQLTENEIISAEDVEKFKSLEDGDNPIIVLYKIGNL